MVRVRRASKERAQLINASNALSGFGSALPPNHIAPIAASLISHHSNYFGLLLRIARISTSMLPWL